MKRGIHVEKER